MCIRDSKEYRDTYRHTVSHILAQAVKRLYPEVKLAIGPSIDNGFYYDFDAPFSFTQEHLDALEAEMRKICKEKEKLERFELPREEADVYKRQRYTRATLRLSIPSTRCSTTSATSMTRTSSPAQRISAARCTILSRSPLSLSVRHSVTMSAHALRALSTTV